MKKRILIYCISICAFITTFKCQAQVDEGLQLRDSVFNNKSVYIGQAFGRLIEDLRYDIVFSYPDNAVPRSKGSAYYQNVVIFVHSTPGFPVWGFTVTLANKVTVDIGEYRSTHMSGAWDKKMIALLSPQIITNLAKF